MTSTLCAPRKILMTAEAVGGVWTYAMELCRGLESSEIEIVLATIGPEPTRAQRRAVERMPHVRLESSDFRLEWMRNAQEDFDLAGEWLLDLAEVHRPDFVHLSGHVHASLPWTVPVLVVAHSNPWSRWRALRDHHDPSPQCHRQEAALARGLCAADAVVAPSAAMLESLQACVDAHPDAWRTGRTLKGVVIYNGIDLEPLRSEGPRAPFIFASGRLWEEAKNIQVLDRSARSLPWPVYVAGEPVAPHGQEVELMYAHKLGALPATEMQQWLARASIFASSALYEPFGLSLLEAAVQGCALVLSDIPSHREVWGDAALYVSPRDPDQMSAALTSLIENLRQLRAYADHAQAYARRYSRSSMVSEYQRVYADLLASRYRPQAARVAAQTAHY
jgi:glycosyltransferase involved in cell wall biosynthesis